MKIIVTGGAGFIGSNLTDALVKAGHTVFVIDNLSTGRKENLNRRVKFFKEDIANFQAVRKIISKIKPRTVFHLAAQINVRKSFEDPLADANTNILSSLNLIDAASQCHVEKIIFSSTGGAIYGDTDIRPTPEKHPENPQSPYGIAKLAIDKYLEFYHRVHGLKYVSLRYANVYGPRQNPHGEAGVVSIFLSKMLGGENPTIFGKGLQTRDYVYVEDVVRANLMALKHFNKTGIYNVGTSVETDVNELFGIINGFFANKFKRCHAPTIKGEQKTSALNFKKIKKDFGWRPKTEIKQGLKKTYEWFRDNN